MQNTSSPNNSAKRGAQTPVIVNERTQLRPIGMTDEARLVETLSEPSVSGWWGDLFDERGHHRLTIDPAVENEAAIGVYKGIGFGRSESCANTSGPPMGNGVMAY